MKMHNRRQQGDVRNRSPPVNTRDHRPTGRYQETYQSSHRSDDTREDRVPRSSQRSSPLELERSQRVLVGHRNTSVERRDYSSTRHFNGGDGDNRNGVGTWAPPSGQVWDRSQLDQEFPYQGSTLIEQRTPKYRMLEPATFSGHSSPSLKYAADRDHTISRVGKEKDFQGIDPSVDGRSSALVQKPVYLDDDGTARTFFTLPPDSRSAINSGKMSGNFLPSSSSGNFRVGLHKDEEIRYRDQIHSNKMPTRESLGNLKYKEEELRYRDQIHSDKIPTRESLGNLKYKDEELRYRDQLHPNKIPTRESYEEMKPMFYERNISHPASPFSQSKAFQSTSSDRAKEDFLGSYQGGLPLPSNGFGLSSGKYTDPLGRDGNSRVLYYDTARDPKDPIVYQRDPRSPLRGDHQEVFSFTELERRKKLDPGYMSDKFYSKMHPTAQGDYGDRELLRPSYMDPEGKRFDDIESSHRSQRESGLWDHDSLQGMQVPNYLDTKRNSLGTEQDGEFLGAGSNHLEFGVEVYCDRGIKNSRPDHGFDVDAGPRSYRGNPRSASMSKVEVDEHMLDLSPQQRLMEEEIGIYDSSERVLKRKYIMDEKVSRHNSSSTLSGRRQVELSGSGEHWTDENGSGLPLSKRLRGRNISRLVELSGSGEHWTDENGSGLPLSKRSRGRIISRQVELSGIGEHWTVENGSSLPLSKRLNFGARQNRNAGKLYDRMTAHRASASDDCLSSQDLSVHAAKPRISIKQRLRPAPLINNYRLERRLDFHKPYKFRKRNWDDRYESYDNVNAHEVEHLEDHVVNVKSDVPEDSEEFKNMVHRAFLQFYKQLNENPTQRRKYKEQGVSGTLLCSVCGSLSKGFMDTHSLASHAAMSLKVGLRAEHLGFHKALCVLMGWNSTFASDRAWFRQVLPDAEALALKEDLVLWPPLVIIHNISIWKKNPDERKVVTIEEMTAILQGLGFGGGKTKVSRGKPANQSIMVVKFTPTFSGLQEAENLHKYYTENKRGRTEFLQINSTSGESIEESGRPQDSVDHVLYGYMGIAEDLDKLEFETKKKIVVKSKKDIQAIADAPLRTD